MAVKDWKTREYKFSRDKLKFGIQKPFGRKPRWMGDIEDGVVILGCNLQDGHVLFWAHNEAYMPRDIQLQVFKRSFSTKGANRGLDTYSIKLLSEKYLKGEVEFESTKKGGTVLKVQYPLEI